MRSAAARIALTMVEIAGAAAQIAGNAVANFGLREQDRIDQAAPTTRR